MVHVGDSDMLFNFEKANSNLCILTIIVKFRDSFLVTCLLGGLCGS